MILTKGEIFVLDEVAAGLKAGKHAVYGLAQRKNFPAYKLSGTRHFRHSELDVRIAESIEKKKQEMN